jgi:hypothetical protein
MLTLVFFHKVNSTVSSHSFDIASKFVYSKQFTVNYVLLSFKVPKVLGCFFQKVLATFYAGEQCRMSLEKLQQPGF